MEAEALEAIFMENFADESGGAGSCYALTLAPEDEEAHVSCVLRADCPADYPSASRPALSIASVSGLSSDRRKELEAFLAQAAAELEPGCVVVFEVASAVREWLAEHNEPGQADESMYAAMLRRDEEQKRAKTKKAVVYESSSAPESDEAGPPRSQFPTTPNESGSSSTLPHLFASCWWSSNGGELGINVTNMSESDNDEEDPCWSKFSFPRHKWALRPPLRPLTSISRAFTREMIW